MLKPMHPVSCTLDALRARQGPYWSQVKHDGFRCIIDPDAGPVSKEGLPIANREVRDFLAQAGLEQVEGELIAPGGFEAAQAAFGGSAPLPEGWRFMAFDLVGSAMPFPERLGVVRRLVDRLGVQDVVKVSDAACHRSFASFEPAYAETLALGGEGRIVRVGQWGYREGKASLHRGEALKIKPTDEAEGVILDVRPREDDPEAVGSVELHAFGRDFSAPVAITRRDACRLWTRRANLPGRPGTIRFDGFTAAGAPRGARFIGVRRDLVA